ncbi:hypothetical protein [Myroides odoratus]|uniref:hypothetical protein n=1 Tax=Myroides odoratus TaxID=256 RepID=UPI0039B00DF5
MKNKILIAFLFVLGSVHLFYGQVVIGGATYPAEGALLDLKEYKANTENITGNKGLLLPRVKLASLTSLVPLVQTETEANKIEHIGLQIYHIGNEEISAGLKVWNGTMWEGGTSEAKEQWIYMPSFPIQMFQTTEQKIDLYQEYKKQIADNGVLSIWEENEVKFVITGYDAIAFSTAPTVQIDNGKQYLVYKSNVNRVSASSYLNIIIVKK